MPSASTPHTTIPAARPPRNRRVYRPVHRPIRASRKIARPGNSTLSFLEFTSSRAHAVAEPHTRFSLEAARKAAGPEEYVFTSRSVRLAVGYSLATFR